MHCNVVGNEQINDVIHTWFEQWLLLWPVHSCYLFYVLDVETVTVFVVRQFELTVDLSLPTFLHTPAANLPGV